MACSNRVKMEVDDIPDGIAIHESMLPSFGSSISSQKMKI